VRAQAHCINTCQHRRPESAGHCTMRDAPQCGRDMYVLQPHIQLAGGGWKNGRPVPECVVPQDCVMHSTCRPKQPHTMIQQAPSTAQLPIGWVTSSRHNTLQAKPGRITCPHRAHSLPSHITTGSRHKQRQHQPASAPTADSTVPDLHHQTHWSVRLPIVQVSSQTWHHLQSR
jgi:hypothetical protein